MPDDLREAAFLGCLVFLTRPLFFGTWKRASAVFLKFSLASGPSLYSAVIFQAMLYKFILVTLYMAMTMAVPAVAYNKPSIMSPNDKENSAKIQSLNEETERLTKALNRTNVWYTRFAAGTVLATALLVALGLGTFLTQRSAMNKTERISELEKQLSELHRQNFEANLRAKDLEIGKAQQAAGDANERAFENEKEAARLQKEAEDEKLIRVRLQESIAPRRLTSKGRTVIGRTLAEFKEQIAAFWYQSGDHEAEVFATELWESLKANAGWRAYAPASEMTFRESGKTESSGISETGILVTPANTTKSRAAAAALVDALNSLGYDSKLSPPNKRDDLTVVILVATRPLGPQGEAKTQRR